ncbi:MAG: hypothetical protein JW769_02390 [Parachlamydiales bacterium]|nr:hypothetical protein [Parachlamydiales bacterium]
MGPIDLSKVTPENFTSFRTHEKPTVSFKPLEETARSLIFFNLHVWMRCVVENKSHYPKITEFRRQTSSTVEYPPFLVTDELFCRFPQACEYFNRAAQVTTSEEIKKIEETVQQQFSTEDLVKEYDSIQQELKRAKIFKEEQRQLCPAPKNSFSFFGYCKRAISSFFAALIWLVSFSWIRKN